MSNIKPAIEMEPMLRERDKIIGQLRAEREHFKQCTLELGDQFVKSQASLAQCQAALSFYADPKDWTRCLAQNEFSLSEETIKEGDVFMAFGKGEDQPWTVATEALSADCGHGYISLADALAAVDAEPDGSSMGHQSNRETAREVKANIRKRLEESGK